MPTMRSAALPALMAALVAVLACGDNPEAPATGLVRGQVTRVYSGAPVAEALVEVGGEATTTDGEGRFLIKQVPRGETTVRVSADAFQDLVRPIAVGEYQSLALELTPVDTLVAIGGLVTHRIDGPQRVRLDHPRGSVWTDGDGRWSLVDAPLGPLTLVIDDPRYNRLATVVLVHSDGQVFLQTLTRDTTVTWLVDHDAYVFMRDDSLNANRGDRAQLLVTADLGRTAVFSLTPPALGYGWAELAGASLALHGHRRLVDDEDHGEPRQLTVSLAGLDEPFLEGTVDFYNRPGFHPRGTAAISLTAEPRNQLLVIDLLAVIAGTPVSFWATGVAISANTEQAAIVLLSSEYGEGEPEVADRPLATYRLRL